MPETLQGRPGLQIRSVLFLASDEVRFITGVDLVVDGGTTTLWH
jgi:hypothetical protein